MADSDPDQTPRFVASDLGLHSILKPLLPYTQGKYGKNLFKINWYIQVVFLTRETTSVNSCLLSGTSIPFWKGV